MEPHAHLQARIVTSLDEGRAPVLQTTTIDELLVVLCRRADRLVRDRETCERLAPAFRTFVWNIIDHFAESGELDEYVLTNILTALATADLQGPVRHGSGNGGVEDYSTFIRRLNPTDPDTSRYFVIGREGRIDDPGCPLSALEQDQAALRAIPRPLAHMYQAFYRARALEPTRGAPRIPVEDFRRLVPDEITRDPVLEEAFLDICFSDGAWELYQRRLAA